MLMQTGTASTAQGSKVVSPWLLGSNSLEEEARGSTDEKLDH